MVENLPANAGDTGDKGLILAKESHTTECRHSFHPGADWRPLAAVWEKTGVKAGTLWRDLEMVGFGVLILVHFNGGAIRTW